MPDPKSGVSQEDFMDRCMGDSKMNDKFENPKQRAAVCNSYYKAEEEVVEALQYGRPKKNDVRKTPAEPSERRKGSKRNKPGSAKKPNKSISFSKETNARLRSLMQEHNKKVASKGKGSRASMGMLKTVYRRGAGAFSRSHAPNMSRGGWGVARVKAFLYLLRNGRPSNPNYKQDNDLLPKSHPRASEENFEMSDEAGYEGMDWIAAEYKGRKVTLNKPFRTSGGPKKFAVYVQNESGNVVIVRFGDPNMEIKRDDPARRKNFRSRHNCDTPGPKTKARYWSCKMWERSKSVTDYTSDEDDEVNDEIDLVFAELWEQHDEQPIWLDFEEIIEADEDCGCNDCDCDETVEAKMIRKDIFDNPGEAQERAKELGLEGIHTLKEGDNTYFMPGKTHEEYMKKVGKEQKVEGYKHKDKDKDKYASYHKDTCPPGKEMRDGKCVRVAVTMDATLTHAESIVEAKTGKTVVKISGVAFHEGMNKNNWSITRAGVDNILPQMIDADVTLNHPKAQQGRFKRNMAGIDEGVVGRVTKAWVKGNEDSWEVHFEATVERSELFEVLESGLWFRSEYGVSIGGTGIPDRIVEAEDGKTQMVFEQDFTFDHLAIVHKPAYPRARIETAEKIEEAVSEEMLKYDSAPEGYHTKKANTMSEEVIEEVIASEEVDAVAEMEKALILANSRIAEFEAKAAEEAENARLALVKEASEIGLKGHEALPSDTIKELMASWEASRPAHKEMKPVEPAENAVASVSSSTAVVANYLNGNLVESPEAEYAASFNALVAAYNRGGGGNLAPTFEEAKAKGMI